MPLYHFLLTPQDAFFFGDERSFGSGSNANYYAKSRRWPQQTTLLGVLRYDLLRRLDLLDHPGQGKKISKTQAAIDAIGEQSFLAGASTQDFGLIERIHSIWLEKDEGGQKEVFLIAPLDLKLEYGTIQGGEFCTLTQRHGKQSIPRLLNSTKGIATQESPKPWEAKKGLSYGLVDEAGQLHDWDHAYQSSERVGIIKQGGQEKDGEGFYRQLRYRLKPNWSFSFLAEIRDDMLERSYKKEPISKLPVGGDRVPFILQAFPVHNKSFQVPKIPNTIHQPQKVHLISDAYVDNLMGLLEKCEHAIVGDPVDFRNVITKVKSTEQYHNTTRRAGKTAPKRAGFSSLYQLIPRGSTFIVNPADWEEFLTQLHSSSTDNWQKIGYNAFQVSPHTPNRI